MITRLLAVMVAVVGLGACAPNVPPAPPAQHDCHDLAHLTHAEWLRCWPLGYPVTKENCLQFEDPDVCSITKWPSESAAPVDAPVTECHEAECASPCEWPDVPGNDVPACP